MSKLNLTYPNGACDKCGSPAVVSRWVKHPSLDLHKRIRTCIRDEQWNPFIDEMNTAMADTTFDD